MQTWLSKKVAFEQRFEAEKGVNHKDNEGNVSRHRGKPSTKTCVRSMPGLFNDSNCKHVSVLDIAQKGVGHGVREVPRWQIM